MKWIPFPPFGTLTLSTTVFSFLSCIWHLFNVSSHFIWRLTKLYAQIIRSYLTWNDRNLRCKHVCPRLTVRFSTSRDSIKRKVAEVEAVSPVCHNQGGKKPWPYPTWSQKLMRHFPHTSVPMLAQITLMFLIWLQLLTQLGNFYSPWTAAMIPTPTLTRWNDMRWCIHARQDLTEQRKKNKRNSQQDEHHE